MDNKTYIFLFSLLFVSALVVLTIYNKIDYSVLADPYWTPLVNLILTFVLIGVIFSVVYYVIKRLLG